LTILYIFKSARKWFWLILLACLIGGIAGLVVNLIQPKMYEATTTVYLTSPNRSDYNAILGDQQAAKAFALIPTSATVLQAAIQTLGDRSLNLAQLSSILSVKNDPDSQFVTILVRDHNPKRAAWLATEITTLSVTLFQTTTTDGDQTQKFVKQEMDRLQIEIQSLEKILAGAQSQVRPGTSPTDQINTSLLQKRTSYDQLLNSYEGMSNLQIVISQEAQIPTDPLGGGPLLAVAIGMLAGLIAIVGVILFIEHMKISTYLSTEDDCTLNLPPGITGKGLSIEEEAQQAQSTRVDSSTPDLYQPLHKAKGDRNRV
jgi:capsular polysaccharide biosynthesis protein